MTIAFTSNLGGGLDSYVRAASGWLAARGHTVHIVFPCERPRQFADTIPGVTFHWSPIGNLHYWANRTGIVRAGTVAAIRKHEIARAISTRLMSVHRDSGIDIVELAEGIDSPGMFEKLPFILKMHGAEWTFRRYCRDGEYFPIEARDQRRMILAARQTHALSRSLADFIAGACEVPRDRIRVVPYSIDCDAYRPAAPPPPGPPYFILSIGRLQKRKGTHTLVSALQKVWKTQPETHLLLFGEDSDFGRPQIESLIPASEHRGRIHCLGFIPRNELIEQYRKAHVYVTPTRYETFGYTILEAMACGRPVIASDIGPISDLVRHEETGWLVPRDDVDVLAETILSALGHAERREAYGREGRQLAERFSSDILLPRQLKLYEEAAAVRNR